MLEPFISHLKNEEKFWRQKSRIKWLAEGEANTAFFHSYCLSKHTKLHIHKIKSPSEQWLEQESYIQQKAVDFFEQLYSPSGSHSTNEGILNYIPSMLAILRI